MGIQLCAKAHILCPGFTLSYFLGTHVKKLAIFLVVIISLLSACYPLAYPYREGRDHRGDNDHRDRGRDGGSDRGDRGDHDRDGQDRRQDDSRRG